MFDYEFVTVSRYDGTTRTEAAVEVFNTVTGQSVCFTRRRPFETKQAWVDRAFADAESRA